jgi:hypothetical protein
MEKVNLTFSVFATRSQADVRALLCYWELRVGNYLPTAI